MLQKCYRKAAKMQGTVTGLRQNKQESWKNDAGIMQECNNNIARMMQKCFRSDANMKPE